MKFIFNINCIFDCKSVKSLDLMPRIYTFQRWMMVLPNRQLFSEDWQQEMRAITTGRKRKGDGGGRKEKRFLHSLLRWFHVKKHQSHLSLARLKLTVLQQWFQLPFLLLWIQYVCLLISNFVFSSTRNIKLNEQSYCPYFCLNGRCHETSYICCAAGNYRF